MTRQAAIVWRAAPGLALGASSGVSLAHAPWSSTESGVDAPPQTQARVILSARYGTAGPAERGGLEQSLVAVVSTRLQPLASLIENDRGVVLATALPAAVRAALPPAVTANLEQDTELEGTLEILHDFPRSAGARSSIHFANTRPKHVLEGRLPKGDRDV